MSAYDGHCCSCLRKPRCSRGLTQQPKAPMSLDAYVRCSCIRDGKASPHPSPDRFTWDESGAPSLTGDPTEEEWEAHDQWVQQSCEHEGYLVSEPLGNITRVQ